MSASTNGWNSFRLDDLVLVQRFVVQPDSLLPGTRYVGLEHVESGTGLHTSIATVDASLRSGKFRFHTGDILFGKLRPNLRKVAVANCTGICSTDLIPFRPKDIGTSSLIAFQMRSAEFTAEVMRLVAGQNLPRVSVRDLLNLRIPVPPASKAEKLCELAALLDEARRSAAELDERVRQLHNSATSLLYPPGHRAGGSEIDQGSSASATSAGEALRFTNST